MNTITEANHKIGNDNVQASRIGGNKSFHCMHYPDNHIHSGVCQGQDLGGPPNSRPLPFKLENGENSKRKDFWFILVIF